MKKQTLIRSDKPHAVQVSEGSSVAQRKSTIPKTATPETAEPLMNTQLAPLVKAAKPRKASATKALTTSESTSAPAASQANVAANSPKAKRKGKTALKTSVRKPRSTSPDKTPAPMEAELPVAPVLPVWEQDNPVKARIEELQALNAQLSEQLQRLPTTRTLRGATS
ncbi:hypothetical protein [Limnohabitans sp.]|uniref:hypothetical protein n=1 Tax=Limnohabitans sp. TaxID=1907725 RepID=UPI003341F16B